MHQNINEWTQVYMNGLLPQQWNNNLEQITHQLCGNNRSPQQIFSILRGMGISYDMSLYAVNNYMVSSIEQPLGIINPNPNENKNNEFTMETIKFDLEILRDKIKGLKESLVQFADDKTNKINYSAQICDEIADRYLAAISTIIVTAVAVRESDNETAARLQSRMNRTDINGKSEYVYANSLLTELNAHLWLQPVSIFAAEIRGIMETFKYTNILANTHKMLSTDKQSKFYENAIVDIERILKHDEKSIREELKYTLSKYEWIPVIKSIIDEHARDSKKMVSNNEGSVNAVYSSIVLNEDNSLIFHLDNKFYSLKDDKIEVLESGNQIPGNILNTVRALSSFKVNGKNLTLYHGKNMLEIVTEKKIDEFVGATIGAASTIGAAVGAVMGPVYVISFVVAVVVGGGAAIYYSLLSNEKKLKLTKDALASFKAKKEKEKPSNLDVKISKLQDDIKKIKEDIEKDIKKLEAAKVKGEEKMKTMSAEQKNKAKATAEKLKNDIEKKKALLKDSVDTTVYETSILVNGKKVEYKDINNLKNYLIRTSFFGLNEMYRLDELLYMVESLDSIKEIDFVTSISSKLNNGVKVNVIKTDKNIYVNRINPHMGVNELLSLSSAEAAQQSVNEYIVFDISNSVKDLMAIETKRRFELNEKKNTYIERLKFLEEKKLEIENTIKVVGKNETLEQALKVLEEEMTGQETNLQNTYAEMGEEKMVNRKLLDMGYVKGSMKSIDGIFDEGLEVYVLAQDYTTKGNDDQVKVISDDGGKVGTVKKVNVGVTM